MYKYYKALSSKSVLITMKAHCCRTWTWKLSWKKQDSSMFLHNNFHVIVRRFRVLTGWQQCPSVMSPSCFLCFRNHFNKERHTEDLRWFYFNAWISFSINVNAKTFSPHAMKSNFFSTYGGLPQSSPSLCCCSGLPHCQMLEPIVAPPVKQPPTPFPPPPMLDYLGVMVSFLGFLRRRAAKSHRGRKGGLAKLRFGSHLKGFSIPFTLAEFPKGS